MRNKSWYNWVFIFGIALALSCGDIPTCLNTETSLIKINFVDEDGKAKDIILNSLKAIDNEDGFAEYANDTLSILTLPLNPTDTITTFILDQTTGVDTIGLSYSVTTILISPECGLEAAFDKLDTTFTTYKKLEILQRAIHEDVTVNLEITL